MWQVEGVIDCNLTRSIFTEVGCRAPSFDYVKNGLTFDTITHGPQITTGIVFYRFARRPICSQRRKHASPISALSALSSRHPAPKRCDRADETTHSTCTQAGLCYRRIDHASTLSAVTCRSHSAGEFEF